MKYKLTEKGKELFTAMPKGTIWSERDFVEAEIGREFAVKTGIFEEVPERIELVAYGNGQIDKLNPFVIEKVSGEFFYKTQVKKLEHCINNEWGQIPENLEWVIESYSEWINSLTDAPVNDDFGEFVKRKINALKNIEALKNM